MWGFNWGVYDSKQTVPKEIATKKTGLTKHNIDELTDDQTHPPHLVASLLLVFLCFFPMPNGHPKTSGSPEKKKRKLLQ